MYMEVPAPGLPIDGELALFASVDAMEAAIVRAILRGEEKVTALKRTSLSLSAQGLRRRIGSPASLFATITAQDVAEGLLTLKDNPAALADWAGFVLLSSELFGFEDRHSAACDRLLAAIWTLAFGAPVEPTIIRLAQSIAKA
jgi:hypothetical protein